MTKTYKKWVLFYVYHQWARQRWEIMAKEFENELDMLIWASKNPVKRGTGLNHVVGPEGLTKVPNDLYERIDALKRQAAEEEARLAEKEAERERVEAEKERKRSERLARKHEEAQCTQPSV